MKLLDLTIIAFTDIIMEADGSSSKNSKVKKPFNKKVWRDKKYGHSHKVDQWKEKHKIAAKMKLKRVMKKEQKDNPNFVPLQQKKFSHLNGDHKLKPNSLSKAKDQFKKKMSQKELKKEEFIKNQKEKEEAMKKYKEKKAARLKVLNAKTKRGQPKMGGRIELLLAQIEEQCKND